MTLTGILEFLDVIQDEELSQFSKNPKAGAEGGTVVQQGDYEEYEKVDTLLSQYLSGKCLMPERTVRNVIFDKEKCLILKHAGIHYLKNGWIAGIFEGDCRTNEYYGWRI